MPKKDYYKTLGVEHNASDDDIKKAYKKLAHQYHPDRNKGAKASEERFKDVAEAYQVLKDPEKRAQYDRFGQTGFSGHDPAGGNPYYTYTTGSPGGVRIDLEDLFGRRSKRGRAAPGGFRDIFSDIFGFEDAEDPRHAARPGVEAELTISFDEAYRGGAKSFTVQLERPETFTVKIPPGVRDGGKLRLRGKGPGGGDLVIVVRVRPHPLFRREGDDLHLDLPVFPWEAALGAELAVPTLDGKANLKIPAGSQGGQTLRLRGKGMPLPRGGGRGDQYVHLQLTVPQKLDARTRELFEQLAEHTSENPRAHLIKE